MTASWRSVSIGTGLTGADVTVAVPSGTVDGDLLVAMGAATASTQFSTPTGWTLHGATINLFHPLWTRTANSEPANYTFVTTGTGNAMVQIVRIDGWASIDAAAGVVGTGALVIPSVTSAGAGRRLMQMANKTNAVTTFTGPGSQTERYDAQTAGNYTYAGGDEVVGSGATGTRTWTPAAGGATGCAYMLAIAPAPPGSGSFSGAYDFTGTGFTGEAGPGAGSFSGGYAFDGSGFTGEAGPGVGTFTGSYDFSGNDFVGSAAGGVGVFTGGFDFSGDFTGVAPPPVPGGDTPFTPGGRNRFTARRGR